MTTPTATTAPALPADLVEALARSLAEALVKQFRADQAVRDVASPSGCDHPEESTQE